MTPVNNSSDETAANAIPALAATEPEPNRDWLRLIAAHLRVAALSPAVAATLFSILSPDRKALLHWGGLLALLATIFCTYIFFGVFAFIGVLLVSPLHWAISKVPGAIPGLLLAFIFGGASAWFICSILAKDMPAFQMAATATAAIGSALLENSWRKTDLR